MEKKTYIDAKTEKFSELLDAGDREATLAYFKDTVLDSYKNGIRSGRAKTTAGEETGEGNSLGAGE